MAVPFRQITAQRGGVMYVDPDNYVYHRERKNRPDKPTLPVKCQHSRLHTCRARGVIDMTTNMITLRGVHTHAPDVQRVCTNQLRQAIIERVQRDGLPLQQIYDEECLRFPDAAAWLTLSTIRSTVYRARSASQPPKPANLVAYGQTLLGDVWRARFGVTLGSNPEPLCQVILEVGDSVAVILASKFMCGKLLAGTPELLIDGTFKMLPAMPAISQLLTIHVMQHSQAIPMAFVFIKGRTREAFIQVLAFIKENLAAPGMAPSSIITDFEPALQQAAIDVFPGAKVDGSWFHYCQAVLKKTRTLHLTELYYGNPEARKAIRFLLVLPLLPAEKMPAGLQAVADHLQETGLLEQMQLLMTYMTSYWLSSPMGGNVVSVHGQPKRTSSHIEAFHKSLRGLLNVGNPEIWLFTESIQKLENRTRLKYEQVANGSSIPSSAYQQQDRRVSAATSRLMAGVMTLWEFLTTVSRSADSTEAAILRSVRPLGDSDSEDDVAEVFIVKTEAPIDEEDGVTEEIVIEIDVDEEHFGSTW